MCINLMNSPPGVEHVRIVVLVIISSSKFFYQLNGQINIFSYSISANLYHQFIYLSFVCGSGGVFSYGRLLHYQIALRSTSHIYYLSHAMRITRPDAKTGRF